MDYDFLRSDSQLSGREGARTATSAEYTPHHDSEEDSHEYSTVSSPHSSLQLEPVWSKASVKPERTAHDRRWWSRSTTLKIWWWEVSCCIFALGALLGIVGTIRSYERKELPQWKFVLNVNAIIAIFTAILKAAAGLVIAEGISHLKWIAVSRPQLLSTFVAYDEASRGPLGALQLMWENQYWSKRLNTGALVSSLGALITILMLVLDPFSQQIIQTYHCKKDAVSGAGSIARTNVYYTEILDMVTSVPTDLRIDLRRAIYSGIFSTQKPDATFECKTGKCNFDESYSSLAFCSSCLDATKELNFTEYDLVYAGFHDENPATVRNTSVSLSLKSVFKEKVVLSRISTGGKKLVRMAARYDDYRAELLVIRWDVASATVNEKQSIKAQRCSVYECVKEYRAKVITGKLEEEVVEESGDVFPIVITRDEQILPLPVGDQWRRLLADLKCVDQKGRDALKALGLQINDTTPRWIPYYIFLLNGGTIDQPPSSLPNNTVPCPSEEAAAHMSPQLCKDNVISAEALDIIPSRCIFNFGYWEDAHIHRDIVAPILSGEIWDEADIARPDLSGASDALQVLHAAGSGHGNLEDVEAFLQNVTDALTAYVRDSGNLGYSVPAKGKMTETATCIEVRWAWLIYLVAVVLLTLVFFVWMIVHARVVQSRLWSQSNDEKAVPSLHDFKSSALSTLFHGLDTESLKSMEGIGARDQESELKKGTKGVVVRLVPTEQGWKLSSVNS